MPTKYRVLLWKQKEIEKFKSQHIQGEHRQKKHTTHRKRLVCHDDEAAKLLDERARAFCRETPDVTVRATAVAAGNGLKARVGLSVLRQRCVEVIHQVGGRSPFELDLGVRQVVVLDAQRAHGDSSEGARHVHFVDAKLPHSMSPAIRL